jgi:hypothetical protein
VGYLPPSIPSTSSSTLSCPHRPSRECSGRPELRGGEGISRRL